MAEEFERATLWGMPVPLRSSSAQEPGLPFASPQGVVENAQSSNGNLTAAAPGAAGASPSSASVGAAAPTPPASAEAAASAPGRAIVQPPTPPGAPAGPPQPAGQVSAAPAIVPPLDALSLYVNRELSWLEF